MVQGRAGKADTVGIMVRVPRALRDRIKEAAESSGRSQNSEIVSTLEEKYPADQFSAEEFLDLLERITDRPDPDHLEIQEQLLNQTLKELGFDFTATIVNGAVTLFRNED